jgi:cytochrome c peroxidase
MRVPFLGFIIALELLTAGAATALAQTNSSNIPQWAVIVHRLALKAHNPGHGSGSPGVFPNVIHKRLRSPDASGVVESYSLSAPTRTRDNPFFQSLGSNGRACVTCHEPRSAWSVSAASIRERFEQSGGTDPIFRPVDGATCDNADVSTFEAKQTAYSLLLSKGLIRIFLPLPEFQLGSNPPFPRDYEIIAVNDPYGCTDLSSNPPIVSVYRRPLPATNLRFLTGCPPDEPSCAPLSIMWDGREASLESQATDAILGHAQALNSPTNEQVAQIVRFESQVYDAQVRDNAAGALNRHGAHGGAHLLSDQQFAIGVNDSLSPGFDSLVFTLYTGWQNPPGSAGRAAARASIARGEALFNSREFTISGVSGLNASPQDPVGTSTIIGTCATCHDSPNVGNHSVNLALDIGVTDANPSMLDVGGLPQFTVQCTDAAGPLAGQTVVVTDLGRALITGKCADVGKTKGPILRGLAARAPYFHNGSAATLADAVNFYDQRFSIGLSDQEKADLVAFLQAL